jgi:hypothetical protein
MPEPLYVTDSWNGIPHYVCAGCGYDTLQLARITEHCGSCPAVAALEPSLAQAEASLSSPPGSTPPGPPDPPPTDPPQHMPVQPAQEGV